MKKKHLILPLAFVLLLAIGLAVTATGEIMPLASSVAAALESPSDFYNSTSATVSFNCSASSTEVNLTNISLYTNRTASWSQEQLTSINAAAGSQVYNISTFADGSYVWNCLAYNTNNDSDWGDSNKTFTVDITAPSIEYSSNSDTSGTYAKDWIYVNVSVGLTGLSSVTFEWNGTNESFNDNTSGIFWANKTSLASGSYTFRAFANDTFGNQNSAALRTVTLDKTAPAAVTGLAETLTGASWILWNWTNSTATDVNHIEVYLSGVFKENRTQAFYNASGLNTSITYELEVRPVDNLSNIGSWTNDSAATTADTQVPNVSLTAPANSLSTTATSIAFSCSGADNGMLSNATLYLASSGSNLTPVVTSNVTGTSATPSFTRTLTVGSYIWNCQFNDTSANSALAPANFTLTITTASNSTSSGTPSSTGNSGGGDTSSETAAAKKAAEQKKTLAASIDEPTTAGVVHDIVTQFNEKGVVNLTLEKGEKVKLLISNASHEIEAKEITDTNVTLIIRSDPIEVTLKENQSASYDLNNNTKIDLMVVVQSIKDKKAKIVLQNIEGAATPAEGGPTGLFSFNLKKVWPLAIVAAALIVGALGYMYLRRKQDEYVTI